MGRHLSTRLPMLPNQLKSQVIAEDNFYSQDRLYRDKQKENYDKRHKVISEKEKLNTGIRVYILDIKLERKHRRRSKQFTSKVLSCQKGREISFSPEFYNVRSASLVF